MGYFAWQFQDQYAENVTRWTEATTVVERLLVLTPRMEYSLLMLNQTKLKEYETDKKVCPLWQGVRAEERYAEVLLRGVPERGEAATQEASAETDA